MTPELLYFTDPYCIWCFGFAPSLELISKEWEERLRTRTINGGMIPDDIRLSDFFGRFPDPLALHERVSSASRRKFGDAYIGEIERYRSSDRILNSTVPSRASATFRSLGVSDEVGLAAAIQNVYYLEGFDLQKIETYRSVATLFGIDFDLFASKFSSLPISQALVEERRLVETLGVQGFPALILKTAERRYAMVARGFMAYDQLKANLDSVLDRHLPITSHEQSGQTCSLEKGGC